MIRSKSGKSASPGERRRSARNARRGRRGRRLLGGGLFALVLALVSISGLRGTRTGEPGELGEEARRSGAVVAGSGPASFGRPTGAAAPLRERRALAQSFVREQALALAQIDPDPAKTQASLEAFALSLDRDQIDALVAIALDASRSGDERYLSAYLLGLGQGADAARGLEQIAAFPVPPIAPDSPLHAQELSLRAVSIEGLAGKEDAREIKQRLDRISQRQPNPFLIDRVQRVRAHLSAQAPSPAEQDKEALGKMLGAG